MGAIYETNFPNLNLHKRGKVRDVYDLGEFFLIVASDRLSAFDVVMAQPIPDKGKVLTQMSNYWFHEIADVVPNHIVETEVERFPAQCKQYADELRGRSVLVNKATPLPIECIVRGYLAGSGWNEYKVSRSVCGIPLPDGLVESSRLPVPIFTPATKAEVGHDENIEFEQAVSIVGREVVEEVRELSIRIYNRACTVAEERGIIIADTKMEFGFFDENIILIDELLTPDSSRFWLKSSYAPGKPQENFDKQFVRDYLLSINFNKRPPAPPLPEEVISKTSELYSEALRRVTGREIK